MSELYNQCSFCKGKNPYCNECSTMGINDAGRYISVSMIVKTHNYNQKKLSEIEKRQIKKMKYDLWLKELTKKVVNQHTREITQFQNKKINKKQKAARYPTFSDKFSTIFLKLRESLKSN